MTKELELIPVPNIINVSEIQEILETNKLLSRTNRELQRRFSELEKYLDEIKDNVIMYGLYDDTYKSTNLYHDIKNKIQELKGE
jgi:hypothetical protein